jgi:acetyl-CoA/propionyl-CoA carboxylase biotin carboxyl carrier protein
VSVRGWSWDGRARRLGEGSVEVELDGVANRCCFAVDPLDGRLWIGRDGHQLELTPARAGGGDLSATGDSLAAPMPGTVLLVHVSDGDQVNEGDVLVVLESMKMELSVSAPHDGTVSGLSVKPGDKVALREILLEVAEDLARGARLPGERSPEAHARGGKANR